MVDPRSNATTPAPPENPSAPPQPKESIKETIESILVAFILAFVFRAFVVEAFVIPSGSMAPTLLGGHMRFRCEDCGYQFDVNYPTDTSRDENLSIPPMSGPVPVQVQRRIPGGDVYETIEMKPTVFSAHCPNCGFKVQRDSPEELASATNPPVHYGDRILVLKYLYLLQEPARWDIVVFKSPTERAHDYTQNFIKRLVGKPAEALMILDGDVYVCPIEKAAGPVDNWPWQVQAKPPVVQEAMWRVVHDNDFYPQNSARRAMARQRWVMPWQQIPGTAGWETGSADGPGRVLRFNNPDGSATLFFNKDANRGTFPFTDWLAYNETKPFREAVQSRYDFEAYADEHTPRWYVSDLKVRFFYERRGGDGALRVSLTKLDHTFTAELTPGVARVVHQATDAGESVVGQAKLDFAGNGPLAVEFMNADYQVTLRVNGRDLIKTTPQQYAPGIGRLLELHRQRVRLTSSGAERERIRSVFGPPRVELSAERQSCQISHLSLWRDVYYTPNYYEEPHGFRGIDHASPEHPVRLGRSGKDKENEYFVLGDNSILSGDARSWTMAVDLRAGEDLYVESGRVPERFLLGKAFFVYWPAGYRPLTSAAPGVIPNFGDMRFIH